MATSTHAAIVQKTQFGAFTTKACTTTVIGVRNFLHPFRPPVISSEFGMNKDGFSVWGW
jgi:hypothetical protein